jgi:Predicted integral membrane protein (DUF2269)
LSFDDWALALHVLSAFALVTGVIVFWVLILAGWRTDTPRDLLRMGGVTKIAAACIGIGAAGTIVLGIWLAFSVGGYEIWDGWIIAAFVLWVIAMALGGRANAEYNRAVDKALELQAAGQDAPNAELLALNRTSRGLVLQTVTSVVVLLVLLDMIFKPGA